jgi:broad specificity phosphatase PhoE
VLIAHPHQIRIHLYLIRHGQSQSNVASLVKKATSPYKDPTLTRLGMEQAIEDSQVISICFKKILRHLLVYTSVLLRAQETALLAFPQPYIRIHVSDDLKEHPNPLQKGLSRCEGENFPLSSIKAQHEKMRRVNIDPDRLVYEEDLLEPPGSSYKKTVICNTGSVWQFLRKHVHTWKDDDMIVLVIHGHVIRDFLGIQEHVPNGAIYEVFDDQGLRTLTIPDFSDKTIHHKLLYYPSQEKESS